MDEALHKGNTYRSIEMLFNRAVNKYQDGKTWSCKYLPVTTFVFAKYSAERRG